MKYDKYPGRDGFWRVWLDNPKDMKKFMGIRKNKKDDFCIVEANLVNAIVLNDLSLLRLLPTREVDDSLLPEGLFNYQVPDVYKMIEKGRALNANKMGYGKTIEAVATLRCLKIKTAIIIAPKPILGQWAEQLTKWWPNVPEIAINPKQLIAGINILNYEQTIQDKRLVQLRSRIWDAVIVDESHRIKTPKRQRTEAAISIPAKYRYALTGTPILLHPEDLFTQLQFLDVQYSGKSFYNFRNYFCDVKMGFFGEDIKGLTKNEFHVEVLHKLLALVAVQNPEMNLAKGKKEIIQKVDMSPKQRKLYKDIVNVILDELPDNATIPNGAVRTLRAQQATSSPSHFVPGLWGAKFEWFKMLLEDTGDAKIVVFSKFATAIKELQKYLEKNKVVCNLYYGEMSTAEREESKHNFITEESVRVFAGTVACMGEGVDGLQKASHIVVFLDRPYSPEIVNQCEDRLNRPGQEEEVLCYFLECRGTYDRHYGRVNENRAEDIRRALQYDSSDA